MIESRQDVLLAPRVVAEKPPGGGGGGGPKDPAPFVPGASTTTTYFAALQTEVFEPMLQELAALEENLVGAERAVVAEYRTEVERFEAATATRVAGAD